MSQPKDTIGCLPHPCMLEIVLTCATRELQLLNARLVFQHHNQLSH